MAIDINGKTYFQITEVIENTGITRQTLWRWRRDGCIPAGRKYRGRLVLYTSDEVELIRQYADRIEPITDNPNREKTLFEGG